MGQFLAAKIALSKICENLEISYLASCKKKSLWHFLLRIIDVWTANDPLSSARPSSSLKFYAGVAKTAKEIDDSLSQIRQTVQIARCKCKLQTKLQNASPMISGKHAMVVATKRPCVRENFLDDTQISDDSDNAHLHSTTKNKDWCWSPTLFWVVETKWWSNKTVVVRAARQ